MNHPDAAPQNDLSQAPSDDVSCLPACFVLALLLAVVTPLSLYAGWRLGVANEQKKAIDAGHGHWTVDHRTGDVEFRHGPFRD